MNKFTLLIFFCFIIKNVAAYEVEDYVNILQWKSKWDKITLQATDSYIKRDVSAYPASFTPQQVSNASKLIRDSLSVKIGWAAVKEKVISGFRDSCGDELLDAMVELYAGVEFSQKDREIIANEYAICAPNSMQGAMGFVFNEIENFAEEREKIISEVAEK